MKEPVPEDFALTVDDVGYWRRIEPSLFWWGLATMLLTACAVGFTVGALSGNTGAAVLSGYAFLFAASGSGVARRLLIASSNLVLPRLAAYRRFEEQRVAVDRQMKAAREAALRARAEFWTALSGHAFERELADLFLRAGFDVERTPGSRDGGVDLVLRQAGRTVVVQCKRTASPVGPAAARDLYGVLMDKGADEGILAATAGATRGVHEFFSGKPLRVMDLQAILDMQARVIAGAALRGR